LPIYEYRCDDCHALFEVMQKMSDDPLEVCEQCGGHLRKVLHPVAIHFKGSGFYTTDYGRGSGAGRSARESAEKPSGEGGEASEKPKAEKSTGASEAGGKPAKAKTPATPCPPAGEGRAWKDPATTPSAARSRRCAVW
jgi:putative FmdB family regulatory protein